MTSTTRRLRVLKLEASPTTIPDLPMLTDEQLQAIIDGNDEGDTMTQQQINTFTRGRDVDQLSDSELTYIISR